MPELPEVETTRRGIEPYITGKQVRGVTVRQRALRWPVPDDLDTKLSGVRVSAVRRRGKYLLFDTPRGHLLLHLGMSGSLRIAGPADAVRKHDHVDIHLAGGRSLRFHDPRRFGCLLWIDSEPEAHPLLVELGPEPLSAAFDADYLFTRSRGRSAPVKQFIMDSHIVVGVGNIYANEALFAAKLAPTRKAGGISAERYAALVDEIKQVLGRAIEVGGTTLRDFVGGDGKPGYFQQALQVYGRGGEHCRVCSAVLKEIRLGQRSTVYCSRCQK
ncbi:MAG: bifunctional DNA-formamidopyrimidine glycosylase/DNA-(apurinic or apyrimidinic site) lyase [Pseudomonadales bacterium]|jgi:formamidopyrimidine-DNA glycosylase|nr:bifunctional DNA-formamidopyrimidine glycosylase/DNA-(apurinic or apyrimidinic site) lyase [Pseudomonadales bacterium]